ncbi:hypothetical protein TNCV_3405831 [Trichonephila clavipes]|nr:hypothetical protein TNCV_3405831 [Trichonephila clavipes]
MVRGALAAVTIRKEIMDSDKLSLPNRSAGEKNPIPPPKQLKLDDLSMWKKLPYDNKYPLHKRPEKDVELFTSDLGKSLYEWYPGKKFELTSDKKTSIPFPTYISLHDPYLRTYFETLPSYKNLVDKGLITPDGKVKVHISEFNRYRMYLHHIWTMHINHLRNNHAEVIADSLQDQFEPNHVVGRELFDQRIHDEVTNFINTPHVQEIEPTTPTEVLSYVQRLKPRKSPGLDQISNPVRFSTQVLDSSSTAQSNGVDSQWLCQARGHGYTFFWT